MKHTHFLLSLIFVFSSFKAQAEMRNYNLCSGVKSVYISDPKNSRGIVVNYDPVRKYFVFLRCGAKDNARPTEQTQDLGCHIYQEGSEEALCKREVNYSKISRVLGDLVDTGVGIATTGGLSLIGGAQRALGVAMDLGMNPHCMGLSYMKAFASGQGSRDMMLKYYNAQVDAGALSLFTRAVTFSEAGKQSFIFGQLDAALYPGDRGGAAIPPTADRNVRAQQMAIRSVPLEGPAYFTAKRSTTVDQLIVDSPSPAPFCQRMRQGPPATPQHDDGAPPEPEAPPVTS